MAPALLRQWGGRRFDVRSGGLRPRAAPHRLAIRVLQESYLLLDVMKPVSIGEALANWDAVDFVSLLCDDVGSTPVVAASRPRL